MVSDLERVDCIPFKNQHPPNGGYFLNEVAKVNSEGVSQLVSFDLATLQCHIICNCECHANTVL